MTESGQSRRFKLRLGTRQDLSMLANNLEQAFGTYRTWADTGWEPPTRTEMLLGMLQHLEHSGSWWVVAHAEDGLPAGHATARPELADDDEPLPGVAVLTHLFVRREFWGSGVADELHGLILDGMRERGFTSACLWTPEGQARARAFYERRGWRPSGARDPNNDLGLELIEYVTELH